MLGHQKGGYGGPGPVAGPAVATNGAVLRDLARALEAGPAARHASPDARCRTPLLRLGWGG
jgi:hypothetical protein